ncbi:MAG: hypothetical protein MMC23_004573 [Stictis urceolatum]|nr:hypothetical protein [Stictis urceolata]
MSSKLDQLVKGAAPPGTSIPQVASAPSPQSDPQPQLNIQPSTSSPNDPLSTLPSSPPQIYLNLLILEASLRSQYLTLRARRRQNTFFLFLLAAWNLFFFYALFLQPREDGRGIGGSVYWMIETGEKMALMGGAVTGILIWGTGQWERGVRWPRRFVGHTNRGLRTVNCKVIVVRGGWWREMLAHLAFLMPFGPFYHEQSKFHLVEPGSSERRGHNAEMVREEDLAPGGDVIKLLLLPKPFSADFRENWESYRSEYWEKENERRAVLLKRLRVQEKARARELGGALYWLGLSGLRQKPRIREQDVEKTHSRHVSERDAKRLGVRRGESHSRNASRSSTPGDGDDRPPSRGSRRGSGTFTDGRRRPRGLSAVGSSVGRMTTAKDGGRLSTIPLGQTPLKRSESLESEQTS